MKHLMTDIVKVVNFARLLSLNYQEFKAYRTWTKLAVNTKTLCTFLKFDGSVKKPP